MRAERRSAGVLRRQMQGQGPAVRRHAGLVERMLQLRLIANQQVERLWPLHGDLHPGGCVRCAVDLDLHVTECRWFQMQGEALRTTGGLGEADQRGGHLSCRGHVAGAGR